jgi:hypothetical protein
VLFRVVLFKLKARQELVSAMGSLLSRPMYMGLGMAYPLYASFRSLEPNYTRYSEQMEQEGESSLQLQTVYNDRQWLAYWVVYGVYRAANMFLEPFLSVIPMFSLWKIAFLVWLQSPRTQGALVLYANYIGPWLRRHRLGMEFMGTWFMASLVRVVIQLSAAFQAKIKDWLSNLQTLPTTRDMVEGAQKSLDSWNARLQQTSDAQTVKLHRQEEELRQQSSPMPSPMAQHSQSSQGHASATTTPSRGQQRQADITSQASSVVSPSSQSFATSVKHAYQNAASFSPFPASLRWSAPMSAEETVPVSVSTPVPAYYQPSAQAFSPRAKAPVAFPRIPPASPVLQAALSPAQPVEQPQAQTTKQTPDKTKALEEKENSAAPPDTPVLGTPKHQGTGSSREGRSSSVSDLISRFQTLVE